MIYILLLNFWFAVLQIAFWFYILKVFIQIKRGQVTSAGNVKVL